MHILFDQGVHNMRNKGNNAMLQAAMERLSQYWPEASLEVVTDAPHLTRLYFPNVYPVSSHDLHRIRTRFDKFYRFVPRNMWWLILELREAIWHRWTLKMPAKLWRRLQSRLHGKRFTKNNVTKGSDDITPLDKSLYQTAIREGVAGYDLFVCTGGGIFMTSIHRRHWLS